MQVKSKVWVEAGGEVGRGRKKIDLLERIEETAPSRRLRERSECPIVTPGASAEDGEAGRIKLVVTQIGGREGEGPG
jgi:hypothetical protein